MSARLWLAGAALLAAGCEPRSVEIDHPFYLMYIEDLGETALFRCPGQPGIGCAIDGLPGPRVIAAGADRRFVVVAQQPEADPDGPTVYHYFARVPEETSGWGANPEQIIGPLSEAQFDAARVKLDLPDFTVRR